MANRHHIIERFFIFTIGLLIMSLGIVLIIVSDFGATPWDVLHVGLFYQFGWTIGTWSIIVGLSILGLSAMLTRQWPQLGAYLNMILVGIFIDLYLLIPMLIEPQTLIGKIVMFVIGMLIYAYGMGIYLAADLGAGPRDSLMLAIKEKTNWKISSIRRLMELTVLFFGWILGGPIFIGTIIFSLTAGTFIGMALPQCQTITNKLFNKSYKKLINRGA